MIKEFDQRMWTREILTIKQLRLGFLTEFRFAKFSRNGSETSFVISRKKRAFSRNFVFRENVILAKISETKRSETKQTKRNTVKPCETKKTFKVREGKKQLY